MIKSIREKNLRILANRLNKTISILAMLNDFPELRHDIDLLNKLGGSDFISSIFDTPEGYVVIAETWSLLCENLNMPITSWIPEKEWRSTNSLLESIRKLGLFARVIDGFEKGLLEVEITDGIQPPISIPGLNLTVLKLPPTTTKVTFTRTENSWIPDAEIQYIPVQSFRLGQKFIRVDSFSMSLATGNLVGEKILDIREWEALETLENSSQLIEKTLPTWIPEMEELISIIIPLVPQKPGQYASSTNSMASGALFCTATDCPEMLAEMIVHEFSHTRLNIILSEDRIVEENPRVWSPFTKCNRPLIGLIHGLVAFSGMAKFWREVLSKNCTPYQSVAERRLTNINQQIREAWNQLGSSIPLTTFGKTFLDQLYASWSNPQDEQ